MTSPVTTSTNSAPTSAPVCPNCGSTLQLEHDGELDAWACPQHHGLGFTVSEAYKRMDEGEIHTIWQQARTASAGSRTCPICTTTMVSVTVAPTAAATTDPLPTLSLDVCLVDEFIWFDAGELHEIPVDTNEPAPDPEEDAQIAQITEQFGQRAHRRSGRSATARRCATTSSTVSGHTTPPAEFPRGGRRASVGYGKSGAPFSTKNSRV